MSLDAVHRFLIAYDVAHDGRRNGIAKMLESYGDRIQFSVFVVDARPAKVLRLQTAVVSRLDLHADSVVICDLGPLSGGGARRIQFFGRPRRITDAGPLVF